MNPEQNIALINQAFEDVKNNNNQPIHPAFQKIPLEQIKLEQRQEAWKLREAQLEHQITVNRIIEKHKEHKKQLRIRKNREKDLEKQKIKKEKEIKNLETIELFSEEEVPSSYCRSILYNIALKIQEITLDTWNFANPLEKKVLVLNNAKKSIAESAYKEHLYSLHRKLKTEQKAHNRQLEEESAWRNPTVKAEEST